MIHLEIKNTEITGQSVTFQVKTDAQNQVVGLLNRQDQYHMNWVKAHEIWGKVHTTVDLNVTVSRQLTDESLTETYVFTNSTKDGHSRHGCGHRCPVTGLLH